MQKGNEAPEEKMCDNHTGVEVVNGLGSLVRLSGSPMAHLRLIVIIFGKTSWHGGRFFSSQAQLCGEHRVDEEVDLTMIVLLACEGNEVRKVMKIMNKEGSDDIRME